MTAICAGCGEAMHEALPRHGEATHLNCEPPAPVLPRLAGILARHQQCQARSHQRTLGPSQVGIACDRRLTYMLAGAPKLRDEGLKWAPLVGTWAHTGIAEALQQENQRLGRERYLIEARVETGYEVVPGGTTDAYDTDCDEVIDWKFVGKTSMDTYRRKGPGPQYRTQGHVYGLGWERRGRPVRRVRIVFLPRWSHLLTDGHEWVEAYDHDLAVAALDRVERIDLLRRQLGVDSTGTNANLISADTSDCRYCPYLAEWPETTGCPGPAAVVKRAA